MLVGGAFGLIPGVGSALGKLGGAVARKVAPTIAGKFLSRAGSRVAQSFLGKGASALFQGAKGLTSRIGSAGRSLLNSGPGRVLTAPFRAVANLGTRAGNATSRGIANVRDRFVRTEAPGALKYSQKNIDSLVDQGRMTLDDLSQGMRDRGFRGSVDVVDNGPNGLLSIDNRRPYAANQAGVERVPVKVHAPDEVLTGSNVGRFKLERNIYVKPDGTYVVGQAGKGLPVAFKAGTPANTWGEAGLFRTANQRGNFPLYGTHDSPAIRNPGATTKPNWDQRAVESTPGFVAAGETTRDRD